MTGWSRFVLRHKLLVALFWLAVLLPGAIATGHVAGRLSQQFALPGQKAYEANQAILHTYGNGGEQLALVPVVSLPAGATVDDEGARKTLGRAFGALARQPGLRVVSYASSGDRRFVGAGGHITFGLVFVPPQRLIGAADLGPGVTRALQQALPADWSVRVTGLDELALGGHSRGPAVLVETLLGALGALVVLAFVFGSPLALVPLLVAAVSVLATFLLIFGLTKLTD